jgi:hypothetical protein
MERATMSSVEVTPGEKKGTIALPPVFLEQLGVVPTSKAADTPGQFKGELPEQGATQGRPGDFKGLPPIEPKTGSGGSV